MVNALNHITILSSITQTWFRIRTLLTRVPSAVSIVFLVAAAKYRYARYNDAVNNTVARNEFAALSSDIDANELTFKTRVCNLLRSCCSAQQSPELRRNALLWRIYLRSLVDVGKTTFEESRDALFAALDECPWNKVSCLAVAEFYSENYNTFCLLIYFTYSRSIWMDPCMLRNK